MDRKLEVLAVALCKLEKERRLLEKERDELKARLAEFEAMEKRGCPECKNQKTQKEE